MVFMGLKEVLISLNQLETLGIIEDYAIGGGYAVMFYDIAVSTYDLDVLVVLPTEDDYHKLYKHFRAKGNKIENVYIYIEGMPVQFLPNYISPLFTSAIKDALIVRFAEIHTKIVGVEHLILLLLTSFRPKDMMRIRSLVDCTPSTRQIGLGESGQVVHASPG